VVGDLALHLVAAGADPAEFAEHPERFDIPDSVIGFLGGELGDPPGGWPEPFRTAALAGRTAPNRTVELAEEDRLALDSDRRGILNRLLFPGPTREFLGVRASYGDLSVLDTTDYLYGLRPGVEHVVELDKGVRIIAGLEAIGEVDERGMRTVMCTLNGQLRPIQVRDRSVEVQDNIAEKADPAVPGQVAAPFAGVVSLVAAEGDEVEAGQTVATIEAMKMEASITSQTAGTVRRTAIGPVQQVEGGDLILVIG
jgi:pyruvate carboxylase